MSREGRDGLHLHGAAAFTAAMFRMPTVCQGPCGVLSYIVSDSYNNSAREAILAHLQIRKLRVREGEVICPRLPSQKRESLDLNPNLSGTRAGQ